jgi:hypothetical protein
LFLAETLAQSFFRPYDANFASVERKLNVKTTPSLRILHALIPEEKKTLQIIESEVTELTSEKYTYWGF